VLSLFSSSLVLAGVWSITLENGGNVVFLKSLLWPGFFFFHVLNSPKYGHIYVGTGVKNADLGYML
jgi:radial spoke head protein 9